MTSPLFGGLHQHGAGAPFGEVAEAGDMPLKLFGSRAAPQPALLAPAQPLSPQSILDELNPVPDCFWHSVTAGP